MPQNRLEVHYITLSSVIIGMKAVRYYSNMPQDNICYTISLLYLLHYRLLPAEETEQALLESDSLI